MNDRFDSITLIRYAAYVHPAKTRTHPASRRIISGSSVCLRAETRRASSICRDYDERSGVRLAPSLLPLRVGMPSPCILCNIYIHGTQTADRRKRKLHYTSIRCGLVVGQQDVQQVVQLDFNLFLVRRVAVDLLIVADLRVVDIPYSLQLTTNRKSTANPCFRCVAQSQQESMPAY